MEIRYEIVPTDITYFSKEGAVGTSLHNIYTFILCCIVILFMMSDMPLAALSTITNDGSIVVNSLNMGPRLLICFAIFGISYFALITFSKFSVRKLAVNSTGKNGLFCEHTITLNEKGFIETTDVNNSFHSWECVEKITETKNYVTIYIRLGAGYFIPKRAFSGEEQIQAFVSDVNMYIETAGIPPPPPAFA